MVMDTFWDGQNWDTGHNLGHFFHEILMINFKVSSKNSYFETRMRVIIQKVWKYDKISQIELWNNTFWVQNDDFLTILTQIWPKLSQIMSSVPTFCPSQNMSTTLIEIDWYHNKRSQMAGCCRKWSIEPWISYSIICFGHTLIYIKATKFC